MPEELIKCDVLADSVIVLQHVYRTLVIMMHVPVREAHSGEKATLLRMADVPSPLVPLSHQYFLCYLTCIHQSIEQRGNCLQKVIAICCTITNVPGRHSNLFGKH